jgi:hypothetical protein
MAIYHMGWDVPSTHIAALETQMASMPGNWFVIDAQPFEGKYCLRMEVEPPKGDKPGKWAIANVTLDIDGILEANTQMLNDSQGQKWGDGKIFARIPLGLRHGKNMLRGLGDAADVGDMKYVKKVLNDGEFRKFRTFEGKL